MSFPRRALPISRMGHPDLRFALSVVIPAVIILAVTFSTLILALNEIAREVDRTALSLTRADGSGGGEARLRGMAETHGDYAIWDDAARKLYGAVDPAIRRGYVRLLDGRSDLLQHRLSPRCGRHGGLRLSRREAVADAAGQHSAHRSDRLPAGDGGCLAAPDCRSALVRGAWGPMIIALGPMVPFRRTVPAPAAQTDPYHRQGA